MSSARTSLTLCCDGQPSALVLAKEEAQKAVALDDELAEGHSALAGSGYEYADWNWAEAEKEFLRALELNPNSSMAHFQYGDFLGFMGRGAEADVHKGRAFEIDPFEPFFASRVGSSIRDPDKKLEQILYAISLDNTYYFSHIMAAAVYSQRKEYDKAIKESRAAKRLSPNQTWSDVGLSRTYVAAGKPEEAQAILDQLLLRSRSHFVPPSHIAMVYSALGDKGQALEWLEKAYDTRDPKVIMLKNPLFWKNVENEPRFQDIKRRLGL